MKKKKREMFMIYLNEDELNVIKLWVSRVSPGDKSKPIGQIIRKGIIALAENPDLDFVFDPGVCLNLPESEIRLRQLLYKDMKKNIEILKEHGIELPDRYDGGEVDESRNEFETHKENS